MTIQNNSGVGDQQRKSEDSEWEAYTGRFHLLEKNEDRGQVREISYNPVSTLINSDTRLWVCNLSEKVDGGLDGLSELGTFGLT